MKKILIAVMMVVGVTSNANAFEINVNGNVLLEQVIQQIVKQSVGNTVKTQNGQVVVHTGKMIHTGRATQCWVSPKYDSRGNVTNRLVCN